MTRLRLLLVLVLTGWCSPVFSDERFEAARLANLNLEELMQIEVSSVSRREERLAGAPAAVFVLSSEDIRRSGATSVPEALRLVPGVAVARISSNTWAVTSRGFNGEFSNKLLVLIDGRSVYTPLFSGVFWDVEEVPLSQIERIEVIRGPGATLWGANAVNGVINIITKPSSRDPGFMLKHGSGNIDRSLTTLSYSGAESDELTYRVYTSYFDRSGMESPDGQDGADDWSKLSGGFRTDWKGQGEGRLLVKGDIYGANINNSETVITQAAQPFFSRHTDYRDLSGGNITARWSDRLSAESSYQLQGSYQHSRIDSDLFREIRNTFDFDSQLETWLDDRNQLIFGLAYRGTVDNEKSRGITLAFTDDKRSDSLFSAFVQNDLTLIKDRLHLIAGSKFEHNDYTGFEVQPGVRLLYTPDSQHTFWGSLARAVRTPSRVEHTVRYAISGLSGGLPPGAIFFAYGDEDYDSEDLLAYEAGYRSQLAPELSVDIAGFVNSYSGLRTAEIASPVLDPARPFIEIPGILDNKSDGRTAGIEMAVNYQPLDYLRWRSSFSLLKVDISPDADSSDPTGSAAEGTDPEHQVQSWLSVDFGHGWEADLIMYYVDSLPAAEVPSYVRFDARVGWRVSRQLEVAFVVQNLFDNGHKEFRDATSFVEAQEIERAYYGLFNWRF